MRCDGKLAGKSAPRVVSGRQSPIPDQRDAKPRSTTVPLRFMGAPRGSAANSSRSHLGRLPRASYRLLVTGPPPDSSARLHIHRAAFDLFCGIPPLVFLHRLGGTMRARTRGAHTSPACVRLQQGAP